MSDCPTFVFSDILLAPIVVTCTPDMRDLKRKSIELEDNSDDRETSAVKCFLRSVLVSSKNGVLSSQLQGIYEPRSEKTGLRGF